MNHKPALNVLKQQYDYVGWVPCISGTLNFEFTTCGIGEKQAYLNANHIEPDCSQQQAHRYILVASSIDWKDFGADEEEGEWDVILMGDGEEGDSFLAGNVYLIPFQQNNLRQQVISIIKQVGEKIYEHENIKEPHKNLENLLKDAGQLQQLCIANYQLNKSGLTYLKAEAACTNLDAGTSQVICRHAYYYIKYAFHKHKHHTSAESLTSIHKISSLEEVTGKNLIGEIKKGLVRLTRDSSPADFKSFFAAKGILSYTKSLAYSCMTENLISEETYKAEKTYIDNLGESLEILGKKVEAKISSTTTFNTSFRSVLLFAFAVLAPFTMLYREDIRQSIEEPRHHSIVRAISWIIHNEMHFWVVIIFLVAIFFIFRGITLRYGSTNLAIEKYQEICEEGVEYVTNNQRSATIIIRTLKWGCIITAISGLILLLQ